MADLGTWRGLSKVQLVDGTGLNRRSYAVSITNVVPDTVAADQTQWEDDAGNAATLRVEWDAAGTPPFLEADTISIRARLFGSGTNLGSIGPIAISGDSGVTTVTVYYRLNPFDGGSASRGGMIELLLEVSRTNAVGPWGLVDSRGGGTPPASTTHDWAKGKFRGNLVLSSESFSNVSLGGAEPASFAFPDKMYTRMTFNADWHRAASRSYTLRHLQSAVLRRTQAKTSTPTNDWTWDQVANGTTSNGRMNSDYTAGDTAVDVEVVLPTLDVAGDNEFAWAASGHAGGYAKVSDTTLKDTARFTANPELTLSEVTFTDQVYNRDEVGPFKFKLKNDRAENVVPVFQVRSLDNTVVDSFAGEYAVDGSGFFDFPLYVVGSRGKAPWDLVGERWNVRTNFSDQGSLNVGSDIYKVSRKAQISTSNSVIDGAVFSGPAPSPGSDVATQVAKCEVIYLKGYLYTARGTLWGPIQGFLGARPAASETFLTPSNAVIVASGGSIAGADADFRPANSETTGTKTVVISTQPVITADQPRTGTGGAGSFAETTTTEIEVIDHYVSATGQVTVWSCAPCCGCPCIYLDLLSGGFYKYPSELPSRLKLIVTGTITNALGTRCAELLGEFVMRYRRGVGIGPSNNGSIQELWEAPEIEIFPGSGLAPRWTLQPNQGPGVPSFSGWRVNSLDVQGGHLNNTDFNADCGDTIFAHGGTGAYCVYSGMTLTLHPTYKCKNPTESIVSITECGTAARRFVFSWAGSDITLHSNAPSGGFMFKSLDVNNWQMGTWSSTEMRLEKPSAAIVYQMMRSQWKCAGVNTFYNMKNDGNPASIVVTPVPC